MSAVTTQFYTITSDAWEAMLGDIRTATHSIDIEQYIFSADAIGEKFVELFRQKIKQGVKIRLLCDTVGSNNFYRSGLPQELIRLGIEIRFFNPISPWRITNFTSNFFRDHRKILVIDNAVVHIGGVGIEADMATWRDTHIRITGPLAEDVVKGFEMVWSTVPRGTFVQTGISKHYVKKFNFLTNSPRFGQRHIYQSLISNIRNAKKYIYLTTPYFIPDIILFRVLRLAARRGVDVRLLVPSVADHIFVDHARESYFTLALRSGIKIYTYQPGMMHAKTAVIDDEWATAGSFNLDNLSFVFNHEANISSSDEQFVETLKKDFFNDLTRALQVDYTTWITRPLRKKFLELITWPFHDLM